ncbi:hypothetical protein [Streptomyces sp. NPDC050759]|uniref:hypothetical protein n=1 Tax=Streptomyces sp. NPDC050759 TaxID=3365635 RepID=UPI0037AEE3B3
MAGKSKPTDTPAPRVPARAAREYLGEFEQRVRRRPGLGAAAACLVLLVVINLRPAMPRTDGARDGNGLLTEARRGALCRSLDWTAEVHPWDRPP